MREGNEIQLDELPDLASRLDRVDSMAREIEFLPDETYAPLGSSLSPVEWYSLSAVVKSTSHAHAFRQMVEHRNTIVANALLRMQIETGMRIFGLSLVPDVEGAGSRLMMGERYGTLKTASGQRLNDKFLHEELSTQFAWVSAAYEGASAFIHLDGANIQSKLLHLDQGVFFNLSGVDRNRPDQEYHYLADTFFIALRMTKVLLEEFFATRPRPEERLAKLVAVRDANGAW